MYNQTSHIVCYLYVGRGRSVILTLAIRKKRRTCMHIRNNSGVFSELFFFFICEDTYIAQYLKFTVNPVLFHCIQLISARFENCLCLFLSFYRELNIHTCSEKLNVVNFFSTNHLGKKNEI